MSKKSFARPVNNYIILDIGLLKSLNTNRKTGMSDAYQEFIRSSVSVLVCGAKPWQVKNIADCLYKDSQRTDTSDSLSWEVLFNLSDHDSYKDISKHMKWPTLNMPFCPELFTLNDDLSKTISDLLQEYIPNNKVVKKKKLLFF